MSSRSLLTPPTIRDFIFGETFACDFVVAVSVSIASFVGARGYWFANPPNKEGAVILGFTVVATLAASIGRVLIRKQQASPHERAHALEMTLYTLKEILIAAGKPKVAEPNLRLCVHVPDGKGNLYQLTDYVGPQERYGAGRRFPASKGVSGLAFRSGREAFSKVPAGQHRVDVLVRQYGFDRGEANAMQNDRNSWIAVPIGETGKIKAIIYCDSSVAGFFGNIDSVRRKLLKSAMVGIASHLASR